jgi:hypothetical protein
MRDNYKLVIDTFVDFKYLYSLIFNNINQTMSGIIFRECNCFCNKNNYIMNYYSYYIKPEFTITNVIIDNNEKIKKDISYLIDQKLLLKLVKTKNEDIYEIYYKNNYIDIADVPDLKTSLFVKEYFKKYNYSFLYFICIYNKDHKRWFPIKNSFIDKNNLTNNNNYTNKTNTNNTDNTDNNTDNTNNINNTTNNTNNTNNTKTNNTNNTNTNNTKTNNTITNTKNTDKTNTTKTYTNTNKITAYTNTNKTTTYTNNNNTNKSTYKTNKTYKK